MGVAWPYYASNLCLGMLYPTIMHAKDYNWLGGTQHSLKRVEWALLILWFVPVHAHRSCMHTNQIADYCVQPWQPHNGVKPRRSTRASYIFDERKRMKLHVIIAFIHYAIT